MLAVFSQAQAFKCILSYTFKFQLLIFLNTEETLLPLQVLVVLVQSQQVLVTFRSVILQQLVPLPPDLLCHSLQQ